MKKVIAVLLVLVMAVLVPGCGSGGGNGGTTLTLSNYEEYLQVDGTYNLGGLEFSKDSTMAYYNSLDMSVTITPASSAFLYNDVTVTVAFNGKLKQYAPFSGNETKSFSAQETLKCNIGGNASLNKSYTLKEQLCKSTMSNSFDCSASISMTVIDVTGSVSRA